MPLVVAAICPHPPLLVPSVAAGAAAELDDLREACAAAVDSVFAAGPDVIIVIGTGAATRDHGPQSFGTFDAYGVRETYALGGRDALAVAGRLPLSLTIGAWLLRDRSATPSRRGVEVESAAGALACAEIGTVVAGSSPRVGLIVMGDGSACRGPKSPGYDDDRAEPFDATITKALAGGDPGALLAIDATLATELLVAGRPAWQVLAGAAVASGSFRGTVAYDAAPYGVQYTVATWHAT